MKAADLPTYYNICEILEHNLEHRGDKIALLSENGSFTFREVSEQVNRVGNALIRSVYSLANVLLFYVQIGRNG